MPDIVEELWTDEEPVDGRRLREALEVIEWHKHPRTRRLMTWLRERMDDPVEIGDHIKMIAGTARSNTVKNIHRELASELQTSRLRSQEITNE